MEHFVSVDKIINPFGFKSQTNCNHCWFTRNILLEYMCPVIHSSSQEITVNTFTISLPLHTHKTSLFTLLIFCIITVVILHLS